MAEGQKLGLIAGNGSFPLLLLDAARAQGAQVIVAAIKEETSPLIEGRGAAPVHWMSLGELSKLIDYFKREGVSTAIMAGQVKHKQIFSSIRPDWKLAKVLLSLGTRNTDSLIGAVAKVLEDEGIHLISSTLYLEPLLARRECSHAVSRRSRAERYRVWPPGRAPSGPVRYWPDSRDRPGCVRRLGSHGRHRRDNHSCRRADEERMWAATQC